jgi:hypothetical protein
MGAQRRNTIGVLLAGALDSSCRYSRFFYCIGCSSQPSPKFVFPHRTLFHYISPHRSATLAGRRAGSPVSVSLWYRLCAVDDMRRHLSMINRNEFRKSVRQKLSSCIKDMGLGNCNFRYNHLEVKFEE